MNIQKFNLYEVGAHVRTPIDILICSSSYEARSLSVPLCISRNLVKKSFIFEAADLSTFIADNTTRLRRHLGSTSEVISVDTTDPLLTADKMAELLPPINSQNVSSILIDVTTFTHEFLLIFLRLLRNSIHQKQIARILLAYTGASDYGIGANVASKWLSKGVREVRTVLGYPGNNLPSRKTHLIALVGYENERASRMIEILEPNSIALGFGRAGSETTEKNREANQHFHRLVSIMAASFAKVESFEIFCNNPVQTYRAIMAQARKADGRNVMLAPMNNKMSTLGAALAGFASEDIQICYAPVLEYNYFNYSKPGKHCYLIELPELFNASPKLQNLQLAVA
jgi:hypothetical protein